MSNKFLPSVKNLRPDHILIIILAVLLSGLATSLIIFLNTYYTRLNGLDFCLENHCVKYFFEMIDQCLFVIEVTFNLVILIITAGGISIALAHYLVESKSTSLSNHLSNFSVFNDYLKHEISKSNSISENSVNIFSIYNLIFDNSRNGNMSISRNYCDLIRTLNAAIEDSNVKVTDPKRGGFSVHKHQDSMLPIFKSLFFNVSRIEKTEYFEIETAILNLIQLINRSFCNSVLLDEITERKYI